MSEEKYIPPKVLHHGVYPFDDMTKYIRADIVEEMREALESFLNATGMPDRIKAAQAANKALVEYRGYDNETDKECRRLCSVIDKALEEE